MSCSRRAIADIVIATDNVRQRTIVKMADARRLMVLDRRDFVVGAGAAALVAALVGSGSAADAPHSAEFERVLAGILNGAVPREGGIEMDLPEIVDNGDYVPVGLSVASPMTPDNYVKAIHLLSTANPRAHVATFRFTLLSGEAHVTSRMRLAKTQKVVAIAELSDGTFLMSTQAVDVKVGGCGL
jgi:sulfur-oxidizing protein SoxY